MRSKAVILLFLLRFVVVHPRYRRRCHGRTIHQPSRALGYNEKALFHPLWTSRYPGGFDPDAFSQLAQSNLEKVVEPEQEMSSLALQKTGVVVHPWGNNRHWGIPSLEEWTGQIGCSGLREYLERPGHTRLRIGPQF